MYIEMLQELALLAALMAVSAAARLQSDETMFETVAKLQGVEKSPDDSEELQTYVSINSEAEQLREALDAMMISYLKQKENKLNYYAELESSETSSMSKSPYIGVMRAYLARKYLSSSSLLTQEELHATGMSCSVCVTAINWAVPKITTYGCGFVFIASATSFCNVIGLGPEDPLTWACTGLLIGSCSIILQQIPSKVASSTAICQNLKAC